MQDPAAAIATRGFDEAAAAKKREGLAKHQRTAADLSLLMLLGGGFTYDPSVQSR